MTYCMGYIRNIIYDYISEYQLYFDIRNNIKLSIKNENWNTRKSNECIVGTSKYNDVHYIITRYVRDTYLLTILSVENKSTQSGNKNGTSWNPHQVVK